MITITDRWLSEGVRASSLRRPISMISDIRGVLRNISLLYLSLCVLQYIIHPLLKLLITELTPSPQIIIIQIPYV